MQAKLKLLTALCGPLTVVSGYAGDKKPDILIIFPDDVGCENISACSHGTLGYRTPHMNRIAREGIMFTDHHVQSSCTVGLAALMLERGKHVFHYNLAIIEHSHIAAETAFAAGKHELVAKFKYNGGGVGKGGTAAITVNGKEVAKGWIERTNPIRFSVDEGMDVGEYTDSPVSLDCDVSNRFTGRFETVTIDIHPGERVDRSWKQSQSNGRDSANAPRLNTNRAVLNPSVL
jgi:hypothetical protein